MLRTHLLGTRMVNMAWSGSLMVLLVFTLGVEAATVWECKTFKSWDPLGSCGLNHPSPRWGKENIRVVTDPVGGVDKVLSILYPRGSYYRNVTNRGGTGFKARPWPRAKRATHLKLEYEVMFSENFDFVKGGKLPGFYGGWGTCAGGQYGENCFSTRFMWRRHGDAEVYAYLPPETDPTKVWFCDMKYVYCNFAYGHGMGRHIPGFRVQPGRWHHIAQTVHLNEPCKQDGYLSIDFDGKRQFDLTGFRFRSNNRVTLDTLYFSTFFGGASPENASTRDVKIYFKNFKVTDDVLTKDEC